MINLLVNKIIVYKDKIEIFFNFTNMTPFWSIGNLKKDDIEEICRRIKEEDIPALNYAKKVTLSELATSYGNPNSTRLFEEDDYKMFLLNKYLENRK